MDILVENRQQDLALNLDSVVEVASAALSVEAPKADEMTIYFVTEEEICQLHGDYFDDPTPTDCITFPIGGEGEWTLLGDLFVCPKTAINYVEGGDPYPEVTLYVVHGILHLLGYDDIDEDDRAEMRAQEKIYMDLLAQRGLVVYP